MFRCIFPLLDAIEATWGTNPSAITRAIREMKDFEGASNKITVGPDGSAIELVASM